MKLARQGLAYPEGTQEMASAKMTQTDEAVVQADDSLPEWKRVSIERSLQGARMRAQERSDRFVTAAIDLLKEHGSVDFTVQDVVDGARMSIRTFYNFFASKDDLLVAVHETILANEVVPRLRARCEAVSDPIARVEAYIHGIYELTADASPVSRALTTFGNRLAETRPADLERAFKPQVDLVADLIRDAAASGQLDSPLSTTAAAHLLHHTILATVHARILGAAGPRNVSAEELWMFCSLGLGVRSDSATKTLKQRR
jgi:AcrR family transcriptional regulator